MTRSVVALLMLLAIPALATQSLHGLTTEQHRERFHELSAQLRCPQCQSQSIGDSEAPIARDMRDRLAELIKEGRTDDQIIDYFVARYGTYVNFKPPLQARTWLLWIAPIGVFLLGAVVVMVQLRRGRKADRQEESS